MGLAETMGVWFLATGGTALLLWLIGHLTSAWGKPLALLVTLLGALALVWLVAYAGPKNAHDFADVADNGSLFVIKVLSSLAVAAAVFAVWLVPPRQ
ncbi:hypothetical protein FIV34_12160 [Luteibacter pinisoli]|uniref:Uncharacterized protein n=1 Tax=Luteibacter pinisoli TaxID=2589080 RepID=A0A4Y5Z3G6_9GAMM|nr:hypothetical protein [Luteibacter pinisoli]QDE39912.1 hypothetical protein FIV34_12160 [Luteibacter pinisoli]